MLDFIIILCYYILMSKRIKISEEKAKILETISIIGLIIFAVISYLFSTYVLTGTKKNIVITQDGEKITQIDGKSIDINVDNTFTIKGDNDEYNIIEIKNKKVRCIEANCPDKICVSHGELHDDIDNDMIICAPHKLSIQYN